MTWSWCFPWTWQEKVRSTNYPKNEETAVPNDNNDYILSKTNRSSHMSLMNFRQLSSTTLLQANTNTNTNINNVDNLFAKELQTIPLILNMYNWNIFTQHSCRQSIIDIMGIEKKMQNMFMSISLSRNYISSLACTSCPSPPRSFPRQVHYLPPPSPADFSCTVSILL